MKSSINPVIELNPDRITQADIIVGIPSYNEAKFISYPTKQAGIGLQKFFRDKKSVIINCDNSSSDGTREAFFNTNTDTPKIYLSTPSGIKGKGNNLRNLFTRAVELRAKAIVVVDADLKSITPRWIYNLGSPLFNDYGFVAPIYIRHKYDGTITNNIAYPLTRCLYGRRVRQPIGGDFGFSGELAEFYLNHELWTKDIEQFGIDIWMTTTAMNRGFPICQSFMGSSKVHKPKDTSADLGPMFTQVIGAMFSIMEEFFNFWVKVKWSKPTAIYGFGLGDTDFPPPVEVNEDRLYEKFHCQFGQFQEKWGILLAPEVYSKLVEIKEMGKTGFEFPPALWAKILFDFGVSYHQRVMDRESLLNAQIQLYYGRTHSYMNSTRNMDTRQAEEYIENQCLAFEETKHYLVERWTSNHS
ncbi:MAG: glycosyl transferase [Deltaproteobacteria bacterium]|nr:glycosyl transferase [Deltaproteobacteria bacterium]